MSEKTVAELMRTWRRLLDINTTEAGRQLGLSSRSIEDIEQGRTRVGDVLSRIALEALVHDAAHTAECRSAALAQVAEKKRYLSPKRPLDCLREYPYIQIISKEDEHGHG